MRRFGRARLFGHRVALCIAANSSAPDPPPLGGNCMGHMHRAPVSVSGRQALAILTNSRMASAAPYRLFLRSAAISACRHQPRFCSWYFIRRSAFRASISHHDMNVLACTAGDRRESFTIPRRFSLHYPIHASQIGVLGRTVQGMGRGLLPLPCCRTGRALRCGGAPVATKRAWVVWLAS